jgi:putative oxidoreductase
MPTDLASALVFLARLLLGGAFVFAGLRNVTNAALLTGLMAARGVPQARLAPFAGIALQVVCGALLIAGLWVPIAAAGLILFLIVATVMFHNFWDHEGLERGNRINGVSASESLGYP